MKFLSSLKSFLNIPTKRDFGPSISGTFRVLRRKPPKGSIRYPPDGLPPEIILFILPLLINKIYVDAFMYCQGQPAFDSSMNVVSKPDEGQADLYNAILVCRSWFHVGQSLLYETPFLISSYRVAQFARSLRECPQLASLVHRLFVLDQDRYRSLSDDSFLLVDPHLPRFAVIEILGACGNLSALTLTSRDRSTMSTLPLDKYFVEETFLGTHLRQLTIFGTLRWPGISLIGEEQFILPDVSFPVLEILSLREVTLGPYHQFPCFPRLHTLLIAHSGRSRSDGPIDIHSSSFPALKTLEMYENHPSILVDDSCLSGLQRLHLFGSCELKIIQDRDPSLFDRVRNLALGFYPRRGQFPITQFPREMESITLLLKFQVDHSVHPGMIKAGMLEDLARTFEPAIQNCKSFKSFVIRRGFYGDLDYTELNDAIGILRSLCDFHGVTLEENTNGLYPSSDIIATVLSNLSRFVGLDDWISERLSPLDSRVVGH